MARFHYSMQSILDIKLKIESQERQALANARAALDSEEQRLLKLKDRRVGYQRREAELLEGDLNLRDIGEAHEAVRLMDGFIEEQRIRVAEAERNLERARERLTEVMKERKTHENLKEKAFSQFLAEENRRESKAVDELTSYVYGQRRSRKDKSSVSVR